LVGVFYLSPFIKHESPQSSDRGLFLDCRVSSILHFGQFYALKKMREDI
jgi:hypothetical protein